MLKLEPLSLLEVRRDWAWIRSGLQEVIGSCGDRCEPEDIWTSVMASNAFVWNIILGDRIGFSVFRKLMDPDGPVLFIWAMWTEHGALAEQYEAIFAALDDVARRIGAKRIRMESSLPGWRGCDAFKQRSIVYEREV